MLIMYEKGILDIAISDPWKVLEAIDMTNTQCETWREQC